MSVAEGLPPASLLLVDDYPANVLALEALLQPLGHALVRANSGEEALKAILKQEFALIIMDVQMPGMDGFQTASMIKTRDRSRHIPIIFLTAISKDAAHVFKGYAHGAVDYLLKPFDPQILRSKVAVFVELWQRGELLKAREEKLRELELERLSRESEARYQALIEAIPQCVLAMRANGKLYYCNRVWRLYSGLDLDETRADGWRILHADERDEVRAAFLEAIEEQQPLQREVRIRRARDGAERWHLLHLLPQFASDGKLCGWIATATDIHDEREARVELERASRAKDEFLATVSHELRNPLNAILGWTRMLRTSKLDAARAERALETIERNAAIQTALIEDMLDVSRIITGKLMLRMGAVDVRTVVAAAWDTVRMAAEAKQIQVKLALDDEVDLASADPERLQQVVWNLLSNAIKFTPRGGTVEVATRRDASHVELVVKDSGQGIPREFLPHVFERFRQADSTSTRVHGGLGLGLAIVRHLVELHGGTVSVHSEGKGEGASFTVRLPLRAVASDELQELRASEPAEAAGPLDDTERLAGVRVVVVDDEPDARELLTVVLEHHGAEVESAGSVEEALGLVQRFLPDALVSDIGMPVHDGYELLRRVRALPADAGGRTPATALTGFARPEDGARAIEAGFDSHMAKPVDPAKLVATVEKLAEMHRADDGRPLRAQGAGS
ncbi:MAG: two-component hybrid sensor and regulator [Myxococcales bacterium]|nr:two-component hybrid sensor and regulator [Myxococcales bacterium]